MRKYGREGDIPLSACLNCAHAGRQLLAARSFFFHSAPSHSWEAGHPFSTCPISQPHGQFGHLGDVSAPFQVLPAEIKRERILGKKTAQQNHWPLYFRKHKSSPNLWFGFAFRGHLHACKALLEHQSWAEWTLVLGNYPTANSHKQSSLWSGMCWKDRSCQPLWAHVGLGFVPLTSEEPFYLGTPAAREWGSPVKCKIEMSNAYKREISWEPATWE